MNELSEAEIRQECANRAEIALRTPLNKLLGKGWRSLARWEVSDLIVQHVKDTIIRESIEHIDRPILVMIESDVPPMTIREQWEMRKYLALSHEDGKCHIYGDDSELQCGNTARHGRSLDFRREPISDLIENIQFTRLREYQENKAAPEPEVELTPDAEFGFVARYGSLTADGKTKDEAMQELAHVILAFFSTDEVATTIESHGVQFSKWSDVQDGLPKSGKYVFAFFTRTNQMGSYPTTIRAFYAAPKDIEQSGEDDFSEYDEATDQYYLPEGWYECNEEEENHYFVHEKITHWMPLPEPPASIKEVK